MITKCYIFRKCNGKSYRLNICQDTHEYILWSSHVRDFLCRVGLQHMHTFKDLLSPTFRRKRGIVGLHSVRASVRLSVPLEGYLWGAF